MTCICLVSHVRVKRMNANVTLNRIFYHEIIEIRLKSLKKPPSPFIPTNNSRSVLVNRGGRIHFAEKLSIMLSVLVQ